MMFWGCLDAIYNDARITLIILFLVNYNILPWLDFRVV